MWHSMFASVRTILYLPLLVIGNVHAGDAGAEPAFTALEVKWLRAGWPALNYAAEQQLPIDIVVQPQSSADDVPLAMGVKNNRCQLVLSLRGNPEAESTIADLPIELHAIAIEAMTAHEVAHCWRYMHGLWHTPPAGFTETAAESDDNVELAALRKTMRDGRREEGFADLVGLAWTLRAHPEHYAVIHAWFEQVRSDQPVAGGYHDTRIWLQLAKQLQHLPAAATPFEQVRQLWIQGLLAQ